MSPAVLRRADELLRAMDPDAADRVRRDMLDAGIAAYEKVAPRLAELRARKRQQAEPPSLQAVNEAIDRVRLAEAEVAKLAIEPGVQRGDPQWVARFDQAQAHANEVRRRHAGILAHAPDDTED